jgi:limonene 1,2-monooxygenase
MDDLYLRSGIFLAPFHNHDENPTLSIERDLELLEHLDRLNYHEAWIGEHHSGGFELIACPEMFVAAAAQRTRHIRLGTGVVSLPYHNPFMLADRMVQLDHMTRGRAMLGVGPGALVHDALKIGIDPGEQRRMMNEAFDVIVRLLKGEVVNCQTDWFNLVGAQLQLRPYTRPTMELAVAAARSPSGSLLAGRYGIGMLSIGGTSPAQMERHTANWGLYEETARANGHRPDRRNWRVVGLFHLAETREQARKNVEFGVKAFADYFRDVATFPIIPPDVADPVNWLVETGTACIGTPDDAVAYLDRLIAGSGGFGVLCELAQNWADWAATRRHYELMARFVHPRYQQSRDLLRESYDFATRHHGDFIGRASAAIQKEIDRHTASQAAERRDAAE